MGLTSPKREKDVHKSWKKHHQRIRSRLDHQPEHLSVFAATLLGRALTTCPAERQNIDDLACRPVLVVFGGTKKDVSMFFLLAPESPKIIFEFNISLLYIASVWSKKLLLIGRNLSWSEPMLLPRPLDSQELLVRKHHLPILSISRSLASVNYIQLLEL